MPKTQLRAQLERQNYGASVSNLKNISCSTLIPSSSSSHNPLPPSPCPEPTLTNSPWTALPRIPGQHRPPHTHTYMHKMLIHLRLPCQAPPQRPRVDRSVKHVMCMMANMVTTVGLSVVRLIMIIKVMAPLLVPTQRRQTSVSVRRTNGSVCWQLTRSVPKFASSREQLGPRSKLECFKTGVGGGQFDSPGIIMNVATKRD
ncbi:unnamed protein product [Protopolystoma xenopodis]|uniref:Uncharacterized protein n=1 Tax=Protopolystoma xenopodis TaxID=117903 RepID=A0A448X5C9_9PLAT|nr:unnamed protein product [Protopolystoma xenopodis]